MKAISRLKARAREYEQQEDWREALASYERVVEISDEHGIDVELSVYNRIGDLHLRLGQQREAVRHYERAADRYADAGLLNNAIALCNKVLRHVPEHTEIFLKLGRLSAGQGFITDARRWFLDYAESKAKTGELDRAFAALDEFAGIAGDPEIREMLAQQLVVHDRLDGAVLQLQHAYKLRTEAGETEAAEAVAAQIRELAPDAPLEPPETAPTDLPGLHQVELESAASAAEIEGAEEAPASPDAYGEIELEAAPGEEPDAEADAAAVEPLPLLGEEEAAEERADTAEYAEAEHDEAEYEDAEHEGAEGEDEAEEEVEPLPLLGAEGAGAAEVAADGAVAEDAAAEAAEDEAPADEAWEPTGAEDAFEGVAAVDEAEAPPEVAAEIERARELAEEGRVDEAVALLDDLHSPLADAGELDAALEVVDALVEIAPDRLDGYRERVEYASRLDSTDRLVAAYLALAGALERTGGKTKADATYRQVLELDPTNAAARAALGADADAETEDADDGYVDLGALLQEDDDEEITTRFVVAEGTPTGDEERDFADMLSQFKTKVAEHMGEEDGASHYDLGLAFKEMGLIDEAINEFQTALRGGQERLKVYEELGECFMLKEQYNVAIRVLRRAEHLADQNDEDLLAVYYHLGRCYEEVGDAAQARAAYERVVGVDIGFRDVSERIAGL